MSGAETDAKQKQKAPRLLKNMFITVVVLYGVLMGSAGLPFAFFVAYLWMYMGFVVACLTFAAGWLIARRLLANSKQRLQFAFLGAAIAFAVTGIALMASFVCLRYDAHLVGFRLHTRIWLDADTARRWAQNVEFVETEYGLRRRTWRIPMTLRLTGLPVGDVNVDSKTRDVTVEQGSPLSGHWGVLVTAKGRDWDSERPHLGDARHLKVEDGVWVFHTEH
jgi:hypothetical protein